MPALHVHDSYSSCAAHTPTMPAAAPLLPAAAPLAVLLGTSSDASPNSGKPLRGEYERCPLPAAPTPPPPKPGATPSWSPARPAAASSTVWPAWPFRVKPARLSCSSASGPAPGCMPGFRPARPWPTPPPAEGDTSPVCPVFGCSSKYVASGVLPVGLRVWPVGLSSRGWLERGMPPRGRTQHSRKAATSEQKQGTAYTDTSTCYMHGRS